MPSGSCLCGNVAFEFNETLAPPSACHCGQCRKQSGHYWASVNVATDDLTFTARDTLRWFSASDTARRGFCATCGSSLFWQRHGANRIAVALGALASPTGLRLANHIFTADKGDYYDITDGLPQRPH